MTLEDLNTSIPENSCLIHKDLRKKNINFYFLRHVNTGKNENDMERQITDKGREQAMDVAPYLGSINWDAVLTSPAPRANSTIKIILPSEVYEQRITVPELYLFDDTVNEMSKELGYKPLVDWFNHPKGGNHMKGYGKSTAIAIKNAMMKKVTDILDEDKNEINILVAGHAVLLNAAAFFLFDEINFRQMTLNTALGEGAYFTMNTLNEYEVKSYAKA